ncbi:hypothetical protein [Chryseobacterium gambrini]|uniref:AsmA-like C-terminal domain-containing protein n=1 Tax=Chryseobacterium gambrini TaxID=373672 RepID=A0ABM8K7L4_9FLAO|nr:hypothetical protein CRDW_24040 [Chryseobacterium gambrini]
MKTILQELQDLSINNPAGYISKDLFSHFTLNKLIDVGNRMKGIEIVAGNGQLSTSLRNIIWSSPRPSTSLVPSRSSAFPDITVDLLISPSFEVVFDIFIKNNPAAKISEVILKFDNVRAKMRAENNTIIFEGSDFDFQRNIIRLPDAEILLTNNNIDPLEASHVEGHLGYGVVSQAVSASISKRHEISLETVFPFLNFGKSIKLAILQSGKFLGIIPTETVTLNSSASCKCSDGNELLLSNTDLTKINIPSDVTPNDNLGEVIIGGPVAENKNPLTDFGQRLKGDGEIGTYIPLSFAEKMVGDPMPSITFPAQDDSGVIGYNARATVAFKDPKITFDLIGGGILLDVDLDINISAYCDFEIFKGLRLPIGWAVIIPTKKGSIQMGFYPSVDQSGTLKLKGTLNKSDMGKYAAVVIGVGTALKMLGVTSWLGFLIDVVLSGILSHGLPIKLKKEISKYMANREWKLIDGLPVLDLTKKIFPRAPFDVDTNSLLASVDFKG